MRLGAGDPGKHRDAFAEVVTEISEDKTKLRVKGAKRWTNQSGLSVHGMGAFYLSVERELAAQHEKKPFHRFILEINNTGSHVFEILKYQHKLPVIPVTTTRELRDEKKKFDLERMDKNDTVATALRWKQSGVLLFPEKPTSEISELERQLSIFSQHTTEGTGNVSYRAEGSEHDDLVMALLLNIHYARRVIRVKNTDYVSASRHFETEPEDVSGSGITTKYESLGVASYIPR
jgi:hypothetical protein